MNPLVVVRRCGHIETLLGTEPISHPERRELEENVNCDFCIPPDWPIAIERAPFVALHKLWRQP